MESKKKIMGTSMLLLATVIFISSCESVTITGQAAHSTSNYDVIYDPIQVGNSIAFVAKKGDKFLVVHDGKEGKLYDEIAPYNLIDVGGQPAYVAANKIQTYFEWYVVVGETERQYKDPRGFDDIIYNGELRRRFLKEIAGKVVYFVRFLKRDCSICSPSRGFQGIVHGTSIVSMKQEYDEGNGKKSYEFLYDKIHTHREINGQLAYVAQKSRKEFLILKNQKASRDYDGILDMTEINGQPAVLGYDTIDGKKVYEFNGNVIGQEYDTITHPFFIDGKLGFVGTKGYKKYFVLDGAQEVGIPGHIVHMVIVNNKPLIMTQAGKSSKRLIYGTTIINGNVKIDGINHVLSFSPPVEINGKLALLARIGTEAEGYATNQQVIILAHIRTEAERHPNYQEEVVFDKIIGQQYDSVYNPKLINGKLTYKAEKNGKQFIVVEDNI